MGQLLSVAPVRPLKKGALLPKICCSLTTALPYAGLPFSKDLVDSKPALRGSNIPAIQLWQKPCWANLFDGQVAAGPIPVLLSQFAEDPDLIQVTIVPALCSFPSLFPQLAPG